MNAAAGRAATVAVVGSGPAGCYLAQALLRRLPGTRVTIFDRLPVPYGLLRYGVAPDHQGTKAVSRQFDRLFTREGARFAGNVEVGRDVALATLLEVFDAVVVSTGLHADRRLGIPGEDLDGVVGSGLLTRALNGHPEVSVAGFRAGARPVLIGAGNVAIDLVRLIVKTTSDLEGSDVHDDTLRELSAEVERVEVVSRSSAGEAKFDLAMLRELGAIPGVAFEVHEATPVEECPTSSDGESRRALVLELAARALPAATRATVSFRFGYVPTRIAGASRVEAIELSPVPGGGAPISLPADSVITAIGYRADEHDPLRGSAVAPSADGRVAPRLYLAGWRSTGPRGTIPAQRARAQAIAEAIASELAGLAVLPRGGFDLLPEAVRERAVDFDGWLLIDEHERARAAPGRIRSKLCALDDLLAVARGTARTPNDTEWTRSPT